MHNYLHPFVDPLLPVTQRGGEEGAPHVQCPEEEGSIGKGNSETVTP